MLLLCAGAVRGQVSSATISGLVKDPTGRVFAKVAVTATEQATGVKTTAVSNQAGEYTLPLLKPGVYTLVVVVPGFTRFEEKD